MITIQNLNFGYRKHNVFTELSLHLGYGKIYGLLGLNGQGKSTLLYLISGLLRAKTGSVKFKENDMSIRKVSALEDMFLVPEEFELPKMTFEKYVKTYSVFYPKFSIEVLNKCIEGFGLSMDLNLSKISMGQKKKAFVCFALATNTSLVIMDEPTNGLDIPSKSQFRKVLASCMDESRTIIISTHQVRDVENLIDHIVILNQSSVVLDKSTMDISQKLAFKDGKISKIDSLSQQTNLDIEALFTAVINNDSIVEELKN